MAVLLEVKVVPGSGRQRWLIDKAGSVKCYLKNPPERGLANAELLEIVAKALKIPKSEVSLLAGAKSRKKIVKINKNIAHQDILAALGIEVQQSLLEKKG